MRCPVLILSLLILLTFPYTTEAQGQAITHISGKVTDSENGEPLPGVNVYLSGTTIGTSAQTDGSYTFRTTLAGVYELVFSMVGYEREVVTIQLNPSSEEKDSLNVNVGLTPEAYFLDSLVVEASNKEWKENYRIFEQEFIGQTDFADETSVENAWVLDFEEGERAGYLAASSEEPLHLVNEALGYHIYVDIEHFEWARTGMGGSYVIYPRFEEMEPENYQERRRWESNREQAYLGSRRHFLRSLYQDNLNSNKFTVTPQEYIIPMSRGQVRYELMSRSGVSRDMAEVYKGYRLSREIRVEYGAARFVVGERRVSRVPLNITTTSVIPVRNNAPFFTDALGNLLDPTALILNGNWDKDRMANMLPMDYRYDDR